MKSVSTAYQNILFGASPILRADLMTITPASGSVLHLTNADIDLTVGGQLYSHALTWSRKGTTQSVGTDPDEISIELYDNGSFLVSGAPLMTAVAAGLFNGAKVQIDKLALASWTDTSPGICGWFYGYVSTTTSIGGVVTLTVKSMMGLLGISMPRTIIQPQCNNAFGGASCGFNVATVTFGGTCTGGTQLQPTASGLTDHQFDLGKITFVGGANSGVVRSIQQNVGGVIYLSYPLPNVPANGDTFNISQGCSRTQAQCSTYGNLPRFKGFPYVPVASTALEGTGAPGAASSAGNSGGAIVGSSGSAGAGHGTYNN
ncbi:MAG: DUF2163 domain-containing protein [Rhodanobacter sp.]